jgi:hypothetical protein
MCPHPTTLKQKLVRLLLKNVVLATRQSWTQRMVFVVKYATFGTMRNAKWFQMGCIKYWGSIRMTYTGSADHVKPQLVNYSW